ncbi:MAG: acetate--CoA ligase family protein [Myxococcales bacterium]|nr:acetate--CoA ligase family protein [Myxococcales bacterium]
MTRPALALAVGRPVVIAGASPEVFAVIDASVRARGLPGPVSAELDGLAAAVAGDAVGGAWIEGEPAAAAALRDAARAGAAAGRPLIVLARVARPRLETAAALAHLRADGAAVFADPDAWIEALALLAAHRAPAGARVAVVADEAGYLATTARALPGDDGRRPSWTATDDDLAPTDAVLIARGAWRDDASPLPAVRVPLCERAELLALAPPGALVGLRPALTALTTVGRARERARLGLGPAGRSARAELEVDEDRLERQLAKIEPGDRRLGDHETKVLLSAYGVPITRQAVATSPSAALRVATKAGFPVDVKPWGPDVLGEPDGCPVERGLTSAADVRRAFASVLGRAGQALDRGAVIVRASPPPGREVRARVTHLPHLGPTLIVELAGQPPEAAPAPLRLADATALAAVLVATRAGEDEPDRVGLANVLRRASHLAVDHADVIGELILGRIVVAASRGDTIVVDAEIRLR